MRSIRASVPTIVRRLSAEAAAEIPEATSASAIAGTTVALAADRPETASASAAVGTAEVPVEASVSTATDRAADSPTTTIASASTSAKVSEGAVIRQRDEGGRTATDAQLRRTISMLRKFKRYERALEVCALRSYCSHSLLWACNLVGFSCWKCNLHCKSSSHPSWGSALLSVRSTCMRNTYCDIATKHSLDIFGGEKKVVIAII